jgi:DNA sulfur modification protein DndB
MFHATSEDANIGLLELPINCRFLINDGQHRHAGIKEALAENPLLGRQTISVVLLREEDIDRNQQIFSDLNRTVQKTSRSLDILYDHRDPMNQVVLAVIPRIPIFAGRVEKDAVSLPVRSPKLVTLSALYDANTQLLGSLDGADDSALTHAEQRASQFWNALTDAIPQWRDIRDGILRPAEVRAEFISTHAVTLYALGIAGRRLLDKFEETAWSTQLEKLGQINWAKTNPEWQGICMIGADVITRRQTRAALADLVSWHLGIIDAKPDRVLEKP